MRPSTRIPTVLTTITLLFLAGVVGHRIYFIDGATQPGANEPSKVNEILELD